MIDFTDKTPLTRRVKLAGVIAAELIRAATVREWALCPGGPLPVDPGELELLAEPLWLRSGRVPIRAAHTMGIDESKKPLLSTLNEVSSR